MSRESSSPPVEDPDLRWLVEHADGALAMAGELPDDPLQLIAFLRKEHSANRSRLLAELSTLRRRAAAKFSAAERMYFQRRGLEQATDERLAKYKADRFARNWRVVDLCCGLGGDLLALAARGPLTGVDNDPNAVLLASANLRACGYGARANVRCDDVQHIDLAEFDAWHLDPDRRGDGRRRSDADRCEPPLREFLPRIQRHPHGAVKLSPAANVHYLLSDGVELEWLGHSRQCQQQVAWFGGLARHPGKRVATWLGSNADGNGVVSTLVEESGEPRAASRLRPRYLHEPQPPVLAAGLQDTLAVRLGLERITSGVAYFGTQQPVADEPLLNSFEVLDWLPPRIKTLRRRVAELNGRVTEVKKRGVSIDPAAWLRRLTGDGSEPMTVFVFPVDKSVQAVLTRRWREDDA